MEDLLYAGLGAGAAMTLVAARQHLSGFIGQRPRDYRGQLPVFDLRGHLAGDLLMEGVIFGPTGRASSRFVAEARATWAGNRCVMTEEFRYESGRTQRREWRLTLGNDGAIRAEADDVPGGGRGWQSGNAVLLRYPIRLPADAGGHVLKVTDWMYLTPGGTIMNRSQFHKFGIKVAELVASIRPRAA
ncbi:MAG: DUF3833 domain-containing protein [Rhodobacteraceae bacterium]|nr:DUF3833 domain-containing protein [Paracoccaceae bacterium]